nr:MAG TPA: hypothetical protein [Caudoviricetes sp.]
MGTPDIPARKAHLQKVLTAIETSHYKFDITNQTQLLTTISRLTVGLCEHIETLSITFTQTFARSALTATRSP